MQPLLLLSALALVFCVMMFLSYSSSEGYARGLTKSFEMRSSSSSNSSSRAQSRSSSPSSRRSPSQSVASSGNAGGNARGNAGRRGNQPAQPAQPANGRANRGINSRGYVSESSVNDNADVSISSEEHVDGHPYINIVNKNINKNGYNNGYPGYYPYPYYSSGWYTTVPYVNSYYPPGYYPYAYGLNGSPYDPVFNNSYYDVYGAGSSLNTCMSPSGQAYGGCRRGGGYYGNQYPGYMAQPQAMCYQPMSANAAFGPYADVAGRQQWIDYAGNNGFTNISLRRDSVVSDHAIMGYIGDCPPMMQAPPPSSYLTYTTNSPYW